MREMSTEESDRRAASEPFVVRFRVPRDSGRVVEFTDLVYGDQSRKIQDVEDFALQRGDGSPTYHLASCVDDAELEISHVIRGQDHLTNTFKHILLFEALGFQMPAFGHLPLLLGPDGSKLSKRQAWSDREPDELPRPRHAGSRAGELPLPVGLVAEG